ncbi:glycoside hydrolase superfamily [Fusarium solani]|uniref:Glycoside hydrolase superfamily n=1 Tax=Fusarium solani TaxID=169388 RepID=A0A9P9L5P5_FUSSL|nr:glycoside hydrolase superfamily [Fusarium solani]KAH7274697.1 glycoside hydrolase superfamily [Fusarium solani]
MYAHLAETQCSKQLIVNGRPFLMLGGELQNSSLSSAEYMDSVWQKLVDGNYNTILGAVTWETVERREGHLDFSELDKIILGARSHGLHLIFFVVKTNPTRFPRAKLRKAGGVSQAADVLSIFHSNAVEADARAFGALMAHIKEIDEKHPTVLMVQVENEVGLLGDSRDGNALAEAVFAEPENLHADLKANIPSFRPHIKPNGTAHSSRGNWETVFGKGPRTDEIFMVYHYARFINRVAKAGKKEYPLPLFTNVWMNYVGDDAGNDFPTVAGGGGHPDDYPSSGATSNRFATSLDFISPDIYLTNYATTCSKYQHRNQPLFIPKQRRNAYRAQRAWVTIGSYAALGTSPFRVNPVDPVDSAFTKSYGVLSSVSNIILQAQTQPGSMKGFFFNKVPDSGPDTAKPIVHHFGDYEFTIQRVYVFGKPGPAEGIVIHQSGGKFLLIGCGFSVMARALRRNATLTGILHFEKTPEGCSKGELRTLRALNGDETRSGACAVMPNSDPDYGGFPISVTIPAGTMIAELEVYHLDDGE